MSEVNLSQSASSSNELLAETPNNNDNLNISLQSTGPEVVPEVIIDSNTEETSVRKGRKRKSAVWEYFVETQIQIKGVPTSFWQCTCCRSKFNKSKTGTTSQLLRHVRECAQIKGKNKEAIDSDKRQKLLNFMPLDVPADAEMLVLHDTKNYDHHKARELIAKMIVVHEYPFSMVEHTWFNIVLRYLNPNYERVSRNTIKNDCMKIYETEKEKLRNQFRDIHRFSLTSDCWTSNQTIGYMCITAHYIDQGWKLQKRIINFVELDPPHAGTFICDAICKCLLDWKIQDKVSTITLDNASNNDVAASLLQANFVTRGKLHFKGHFFHVRCCAHILNIMVQFGLKEIQDIIYNIREAIKYIKKSPARLHKFVEISKQLGISTTKGLCIDVPTRWNSTFFMLESAMTYRNVFPHFASRDSSFTWLPSDVEWDKYEKIRIFLSVFNTVTNMISASSYPTANIFLPAVLHIKKLLLDESISSDDFNRNMALAMRGKFDKYWGECNLLMSVAVVLDPRFKMKFIHFSFGSMYTSNESGYQIQKVQDVICEIYNTYVSDVASTSSANDSGSSKMATDSVNCKRFDCVRQFKDFVVTSGSIQPTKSDLEVYLEEGLYCDDNETFDILHWWKSNTLKYPCLSKMARDILSIPITTVASESAFSMGGRVLNDYRSSLSTKSVNALICASNWIRSSTSSIKTHLQELMEEEHLHVALP